MTDRISELKAQATPVELAALDTARDAAAKAIQRLREEFEDIDSCGDLALAVIGSIGRLEMTSGSDLDIALLSDLPSDDPELSALVRDIETRCEDLGFELSNPNGFPKFGKLVPPGDLGQRIGMDADSNTDMTLRMCLLLESVPIAGEPVWRRAVDRLIDVYLSKNTLRDRVPPRFLLNEIRRFWSTMTVDYEGKMRERQMQGWALRNGKLRTVRKMLAVSGLLPVLRAGMLEADAIPSFLRAQFVERPADRVAATFLEMGMPDDGARTLQAYSQFLAILDEPAKRVELDALAEADRHHSRTWQEVKQCGEDFQRGLTALLFESGLEPYTKRYAVL